LEVLDLASNHLKELPAEIGRLVALRSLTVAHNQLTSLPTEVQH
jgi:Leucine-rich repeat (LRR) protein